ncbi:protein kinase [Strigomonas culicis]|uniref:Protein kinase n=1 Tax=Strigomonas culicis TaxID=28005 RepID=S9USZ3_9TRYP|nr:protein kinase [Strigomonas culicis]|eukprot:EPY31934.1 protein kinase [Strigomonas culicis]
MAKHLSHKWNYNLFIPGAQWQPNCDVDVCTAPVCDAPMGIFKRHHCRWCGRIFCGPCAPYVTRLDGISYRRCRRCQLPVIFRSFINPCTNVRESTPLTVILSFLNDASINALIQCCSTMLNEFPIPNCIYYEKVEDRFPTFIPSAQVGKGGFGQVYFLTDRRNANKRYVAVKSACKSTNMTYAAWRRALTEVDIMRGNTHPNLPQFYECFQTMQHFYIVMEAMRGGKIRVAYRFITKHSLPVEPFVAHVIAQVAEAIHYLDEERNVVHRDIKLDNIVLSSDYRTAVLIDFGLSVLAEGYGAHTLSVAGSPGYVSPENLTAAVESTPLRLTRAELVKADIFSLGIVAYILLTGRFATSGKTCAQQRREILNGLDFDSFIWDQRSEEAKDLVRQMLEVNMNERASYIDIVSHPFIQRNQSRHDEIVEYRKSFLEKEETQDDDMDFLEVEETDGWELRAESRFDHSLKHLKKWFKSRTSILMRSPSSMT